MRKIIIYSQHHNQHIMFLKKIENYCKYWTDSRASNQFKRVARNLSSLLEVKRKVATNLNNLQTIKIKVVKMKRVS